MTPAGLFGTLQAARAGQTGEALEYVGNARALSPFSAVRRTLGEVGRSVRWSQACLESFFCYSNSC